MFTFVEDNAVNCNKAHINIAKMKPDVQCVRRIFELLIHVRMERKIENLSQSPDTLKRKSL